MAYLDEIFSNLISSFYANFHLGLRPYKPPPLALPPLDGTNESLRLFVLLPGSWYRSIQGDLVSANFSDHPEYHVLSYASSENEKESKPIWINGAQVNIKPSLRHALYHLRHSTEPQPLWVEELCVNQNSMAERNSQASLRGFIYRRAESVLLWLGARGATFDTNQTPADYFTALEQARQSSKRTFQMHFRTLLYERENRLRAMRELERRVARADQSPEELKYRIDLLEQEDAELGRVIHDIATQPHVKTERESFLQDIKPCLDRLVMNPLWKQTWLLPEMMLAPEIKIAYGKGFIPWDSFTNWLSYYDKTIPDTPSIKSILYLDQMRQARYRNVAKFSLAKLLDLSKKSSCKAPHDRIYALLDLAYDHFENKISVDYRKPLFELYEDTVRFQNSESSRKPEERAIEMARFSSLASRALAQGWRWRQDWAMIDTKGTRETMFQSETLPFVGEDEYQFLLQEKKQAEAEFGLRGLAMRIEHLGPRVSTFQASSHAMRKWDASTYAWLLLDDNLDDMMTRSENLKRALARRARSLGESIGNLALTDSTSNPKDLRLFLGTGGIVGLVPGNAEKGDLIYQFWNHRDCAVLSANTAYPATGGGQQYKLVGKGLIAGKEYEAEWEVVQDKKRFANSTGQSGKGGQVLDLHTSLDTLLLLSS